MGFANNVIPAHLVRDPEFMSRMLDNIESIPADFPTPRFEEAPRHMLSVQIIAKTVVQPGTIDILDWADVMGDSDAEYLSEFSGRACYQSWDRPNPETASAQDYIKKNILAKGHESVLEHSSASFYVTGISRAAGYELLRHRHLSRSELSQRYVDMADVEFVQVPALREAMIGVDWATTHESYGELMTLLDEDTSLSRKEKREAARTVLPNATETSFVVTGNLRAWRHVVKLRGALDADAEVREFAVAVYRLLSEDSPSIWADMELATADDGREYIA